MGSMPEMFLSLVLLVVLAGVQADPAPADPPPPDSACPWLDLDCLFHGIARVEDATSWEGCAVQCAALPSCNYWSWRSETALFNPYGCWLKSACLATLPDSTMFSGHSSCTHA